MCFFFVWPILCLCHFCSSHQTVTLCSTTTPTTATSWLVLDFQVWLKTAINKGEKKNDLNWCSGNIGTDIVVTAEPIWRVLRNINRQEFSDFFFLILGFESKYLDINDIENNWNWKISTLTQITQSELFDSNHGQHLLPDSPEWNGLPGWLSPAFYWLLQGMLTIHTLFIPKELQVVSCTAFTPKTKNLNLDWKPIMNKNMKCLIKKCANQPISSPGPIKFFNWI